MRIAHYYSGAASESLTLTPEQLARHLYVIGKTGVGKSTLLENLTLQLIEDGAGLIYIDPHGPSAERIIEAIPSRRTRDTCYLKATDHTPVGFNPMANVESAHQFTVAGSIVASMRHVFHDRWGPRLEWFLLNAVHLCVATNRTLADVPRLFSNPHLRDTLTARIRDPALSAFWREEFPNYPPKYLDEAKGPLLNKVGLPGLPPVAGKSLTAACDAGRLTSNGGLVALREVELKLGIVDVIEVPYDNRALDTASFADPRRSDCRDW